MKVCIRQSTLSSNIHTHIYLTVYVKLASLSCLLSGALNAKNASRFQSSLTCNLCGKYTFKTFIQVGWIIAFFMTAQHLDGFPINISVFWQFDFDLKCVAVQRKCTVQKCYDCCLCCSYRSTFPTNDLTPNLILLLGELKCMGLKIIV